MDLTHGCVLLIRHQKDLILHTQIYGLLQLAEIPVDIEEEATKVHNSVHVQNYGTYILYVENANILYYDVLLCTDDILQKQIDQPFLLLATLASEVCNSLWIYNYNM